VGARVLAVDPGRVRVAYAVKPEFMHPGRAVQGGIVTAYVDIAMALAAQTLCDDRELMTTSQLSIVFLAPVTQGPVYGEGHVTRRGRSTFFMEGTLTDDAGQQLAHATSVGAARRAVR
jgi:uncharacterized protein (TIGR00369 family)